MDQFLAAYNQFTGLNTMLFGGASGTLQLLLYSFFGLISWLIELIGELCAKFVKEMINLHLVTASTSSTDGNLAKMFDGILSQNGGPVKEALHIIQGVVGGIFLLAVLFYSIQIITRSGEASLKKNLSLLITSFLLANAAPYILAVMVELGELMSQPILKLFPGDAINTALGSWWGILKFNMSAGAGEKELALLIISLVFQVITVGALVKLTLMLTERIIRLIYLTIVSPLYFAMGLLPNKGAKGFVGKWWEESFKWIISLPLAVLILSIVGQFITNAGIVDQQINGGFITFMLRSIPGIGGVQEGKDATELFLVWALATAGMAFAGSIPQVLDLKVSGATQGASKFIDRYAGPAAVGGALGWAGRGLVQTAYNNTLAKPVGLASDWAKVGLGTAKENMARITEHFQSPFAKWMNKQSANAKARLGDLEDKKGSRNFRQNILPVNSARQKIQASQGAEANTYILPEAYTLAQTAAAAGKTDMPLALQGAAPVPLAGLSDDDKYDLIHGKYGRQAQMDLLRNGNFRSKYAVQNSFQKERTDDLIKKANESAKNNSVQDNVDKVEELATAGTEVTEAHLVALNALRIQSSRGSTAEKKKAAAAFMDLMERFRGKFTDIKPQNLSMRGLETQAAGGYPAYNGLPGGGFSRAGGPGMYFFPEETGGGILDLTPPSEPGGELDHGTIVRAESNISADTDKIGQLDHSIASNQAQAEQIKSELAGIAGNGQSEEVELLKTVSPASVEALTDKDIRSALATQHSQNGSQNIKAIASQIQSELDDIWSKDGDNPSLRRLRVSRALMDKGITDADGAAKILATVKVEDLDKVGQVAAAIEGGTASPAALDYASKTQQLQQVQLKIQDDTQARTNIQQSINQARTTLAQLNTQLAQQATNNPAFTTLVTSYVQRGGSKNTLVQEIDKLLRDTRAVVARGGGLSAKAGSLTTDLQSNWGNLINKIGISDFRGVDSLSSRYKDLSLQDLLDLGTYVQGAAK